MEFPQYRKYTNLETYFLIESKSSFIEIKVIGSKYSKHFVNAVQYPEQLLIADMLENREDRWETVLESVFLNKIKLIETTKTKIGG